MADDKLIALAERCEKASGPDRVLDEALAVAIGGFVADRHRPGMFRQVGTQYSGYGIPAYTASIDAALMLVPEGDAATISTRSPAAACLGNARWCYAATPALALCATALRAGGA